MSAGDALAEAMSTLFGEWAQQCRPRYCYLHGWEVRRDLGDYYRICAECGHTYVTDLAVLNEHWVERGQINAARQHTGEEPLPLAADAAEVTYCPLCGTDWSAVTTP